MTADILASRPRVLSIAGTDPTGGAGIHADIKAISAAGGYALAAITTIVSQNTQRVLQCFTPPREVLAAQLTAISQDVVLDGIKIGMLGTAETIDTVQNWLETSLTLEIPIVIDPVMIASSGKPLLADDALPLLRKLLQRATVITPNIPELAALMGVGSINSFAQACDVATSCAQQFQCAVVVKGGHLHDPQLKNAIITSSGKLHSVEVPRVATRNTHGTGCSFSAAFATRLAARHSLIDALQWTSEWMHTAISHADALCVGKGSGPLDHFAHCLSNSPISAK
ncbi:bifunctional hydroxymethylpyrimidine kinase/phosphomethylpyrimidine kinase [Corynebacterium sp. HS2168-gen11]|uniref:bifunctional hydroxymethylpyrimidine kinase/phosphomethylpyrimidine kinase n=1 Tax=Corynebacterium sp. HS2168-gen11 TaxID=2974027 RepID=UPI00216B43EA|nr:bifunctional hydroxymethylpyrimidine kinase/phosphomethylpyrimidine kinase [Corynebacterium sp. HS2168-gen11]MCS4535057.1 bifunctional hydroxymethylpyrimidine kinase/phosphomethylpyrimidine kinase [Corynebacterium sp. HS2168-gen11]